MARSNGGFANPPGVERGALVRIAAARAHDALAGENDGEINLGCPACPECHRALSRGRHYVERGKPILCPFCGTLYTVAYFYCAYVTRAVRGGRDDGRI